VEEIFSSLPLEAYAGAATGLSFFSTADGLKLLRAGVQKRRPA
jgi:hypothetical protein